MGAHNDALERLKKIMNNVDGNMPPRLNKVIESEIYAVLINYLDLSPDDLDAEVTFDGEKYTFIAKAEAPRIKTFKQI